MASEFELIRRLAARLGDGAPEGAIGIGDDAAAVPWGEGWLLLTCDIAVEGRHFQPGAVSMADVGWKTATANVSDIVACGGEPRHALISLGVPAGTGDARLDELYDGIGEAAAAYGFAVLGGNVSRSVELIVDVFMTGTTQRFVPRGGAQPGERVAVSGTLGGSAAGLELLGREPRNEVERLLLQRHCRPRARTDLSETLSESASAAIDISDGLSSELHHLARASGVRLEIDPARIPCLSALREWAEARGEDPLERALHGGEEYEILCAYPPERDALFAEAGFTAIGEVGTGEGVFLGGQPLAAKGWDHLAE